jgi:hypothetical protein
MNQGLEIARPPRSDGTVMELPDSEGSIALRGCQGTELIPQNLPLLTSSLPLNKPAWNSECRNPDMPPVEVSFPGCRAGQGKGVDRQ